MYFQKQLRFIRDTWHPLWRLRKMPIYRHLQSKYDFTLFINISGVRDKVAVKFLRDFSLIVNPNNIEPEIKEAFNLVLNLTKPKVFWDIGSNIGYYSWFVRQYPSIQNIVLFEPDPINFSLLQKTISRNQIKNCEVLNVAVSDQIGKADFIIDKVSGTTGSLEVTSTTTDSSTLHSHYGMGDEIITCRTVTIDSITSNKSLPDFLKIDVEGAEHLVMSGAVNYIEKHKPIIIMETDNKSLINQIQNRGYTVFKIDEGNFLFVKNELNSFFKTINERIPYY